MDIVKDTKKIIDSGLLKFGQKFGFTKEDIQLSAKLNDSGSLDYFVLVEFGRATKIDLKEIMGIKIFYIDKQEESLPEWLDILHKKSPS